jgi:threonylcarbamoyladenosine tRNA methylthiotransferase MtaB
MSKFFVYTFGCRCNQSDSAAIRQGLFGKAHQETADPCDAELLVVNTCTVTHRADQQVRQTLRKLHRENSGARLVVTGCYAERDPQALAAIPGVDLVLGNSEKERLAEIVEDDPLRSTDRVIRTPVEGARDYLLTPMSHTGGKTRPVVKLQDGCDARCSYCIVPSVRGPGRSARPEDILAEIRNLVARGAQEIVLTGVHLGTYGRKFAEPTSLAELLEQILCIPGLGRLRLSSIEPMRFSPGLVKLALRHPNFARHFHIPLQSGSDRILRRMRRPYTAARFLDLLQYIRESLPEAALGSDVLAGFPGETDEDFEQTCSLIERSPLTYLHVFPFSAREGTDAFAMPHPTPASALQERTRRLRRLSQEKNFAFRRQFAGQHLAGITLAREEEMGESVVLTENYLQVKVPPGAPPNTLVTVRIDRVLPSSIEATILE